MLSTCLTLGPVPTQISYPCKEISRLLITRIRGIFRLYTSHWVPGTGDPHVGDRRFPSLHVSLGPRDGRPSRGRSPLFLRVLFLCQLGACRAPNPAARGNVNF